MRPLATLAFLLIAVTAGRAEPMPAALLGNIVAAPAAVARAAGGIPILLPGARGREANCSVIESAAETQGLPLEFFVRLIRQESAFNPAAVSPAGAQGIAQFMPTTARERGLEDPFEPVSSLYESARLLADLRRQFGNLGLAAAAYNAGPQRVADWLAGKRTLPAETRAYVRIITGAHAETFADGKPDADGEAPQSRLSCQEMARRYVPVRVARGAAEPAAKENWGPWGLQLAGDWSRNKALADYRKLQKRFGAVLGDREPMVVTQRMAGLRAPRYLVRVAESSRARADSLCRQLAKLGGACLVYRN